MGHKQIGRWFGLVFILALVAALGCQKLTPLEKVNKARGEVTVELSSWIVRSAPQELPPIGAAESEEAANMSADGEEEVLSLDLPEIALMQDVILDMFVVRGKADLPGITVDIVQADAQESVKGTTLQWIDFESIPVGGSAQVTRVLEGINLEDGDLFFVEIKGLVSPEARADYQEFASIN